MDLHAVHDGQVLVGPAAAHGEPAAELLGGGHARQGLEGPEDVVGGARHRHDLDRAHQELGGTRQRRGRGDHVDPFLEAGRLVQQEDLDRWGRAWRGGGEGHRLGKEPKGGHLEGDRRSGGLQAEAARFVRDGDAVTRLDPCSGHGRKAARVEHATLELRPRGDVLGPDRKSRAGQRGRRAMRRERCKREASGPPCPAGDPKGGA